MLLDLLNPARILFGPGANDRIGTEIARLGKKPLIVTGRKSLVASGNLDRVASPLRQLGIKPVFFADVEPEPTVGKVDEVRQIARENRCDLIVGVGGGSVLDVAKAAAGLYGEDEPTRVYLYGREVTATGLPWLAIPTTAGSGSEVTENAVLTDPEEGKKGSIRNGFWMASTAIVDPIFTMSMPKKLTAITGFDALSHAIESYTSRWANPYSSSLSQAAAALIMQNLYTAFSTNKKEAREKMMLASLMAGMSLNVARSGAVHSLAHPLGQRYGLSHGLVCAVLLPSVMRYNLPLVDTRYADLAYAVNLSPRSTPPEEAAERLIFFVEKAVQKLEVPSRLSQLGVKEEDLAEIANLAHESASLSANPRRTQREDLLEILRGCW
ncbi:MAG: iron-containing alcohol dehydrogenase [Firmicutes bacterium]|nr:iron-containing alcohol dehydrogenase [Bacillota bacterium]